MISNKLKERIAEIRAKSEKFAQEHFVANRVSEEVQKMRYDICLECPNLYRVTNRCNICGCFMGIKTWMKNEECPVKKWTKVSDQ